MKQSRSTHKHKHGFSLIELLVVMAIIAILMGLVIGVSGAIQRKTAVARATAELADLMTELELYKSDNGRYPATNSGTIMLRGTNPEGFMDWYEDKYPGTLFTTIDIATLSGIETFVDPWGQPIRYDYDSTRPFFYLIGSRGPDTVNGSNSSNTFGTGDDLTNRNGVL